MWVVVRVVEGSLESGLRRSLDLCSALAQYPVAHSRRHQQPIRTWQSMLTTAVNVQVGNVSQVPVERDCVATLRLHLLRRRRLCL